MKKRYLTFSLLLCCSFISACFAQNTTVPFYIILGQSNTGWSPANDMSVQQASTYKGVIPATEIWNPGRGAWSAVIEPLNVGLNTMCENYADPTQFGPEASLMLRLQQQFNRKRLVYKQGQGGTTLAVDWRPPAPGQYAWQAGPRWQQFAEWIALSVSQANAKGYKLDLKGIIWMQGEDDAKTSNDANAYTDNLAGFFSAVEGTWRNLAATYNFPQSGYRKVLGRIYAPVAYPFREIVRQAEARYCADVANNAILINCDQYTLQDWVHYNASAQIQFGIDIFTAAAFEQPSGTLPITIGSLKGVRQGNNIVLSWSAQNESNTTVYEIETSLDGVSFSKAGELTATPGTGASSSYSWTDKTPAVGANYYRIKSIFKTGVVSYTQVVKISSVTANADIQVYPNPVVHGNINVRFTNQPAGTYKIRLHSSTGQLLLAKQIIHEGGSVSQAVIAPGRGTSSKCTLEIISPDNKRTIIPVIL